MIRGQKVQPFKADLAYNEIYRQAKKSIYVIDNYISIKTLELLINCAPGAEIVIFSDNLMRGLCTSCNTPRFCSFSHNEKHPQRSIHPASL